MTPIDWKLQLALEQAMAADPASRHSLVTPIDWKRSIARKPTGIAASCRHSLVTPIDWKLHSLKHVRHYIFKVAILW